MTDTQLQTMLSHIGKNLYRIRREKNLKQYNVARALRLNESVISQVERGCYESFSFRLLFQLVHYYKVDINEILRSESQ